MYIDSLHKIFSILHLLTHGLPVILIVLTQIMLVYI